MDSLSPYCCESLISSLFLLRDVLFCVIVSIANFIEDSDSGWRSFNSFKPWKTWEDRPLDITFEWVAVFFAMNFTRSRIRMSLVELCEFRTLSAPVYAKHRHSRGRRAGILSICKSERPFSKIYGVLVQVGSDRNKWFKISGRFQPMSTVLFPIACSYINLLFPTSNFLCQLPQQAQCFCEGNALSSSVHHCSTSEHCSYEHYCTSSVHYCEVHFHIHVFLRSSKI